MSLREESRSLTVIRTKVDLARVSYSQASHRLPKLESDAVGSTRRRCNEASRLHFENEQSGTLRLHRLPRRIPSIRSCRSPSFESQKKRPFGL